MGHSTGIHEFGTPFLRDLWRKSTKKRGFSQNPHLVAGFHFFLEFTIFLKFLKFLKIDEKITFHRTGTVFLMKN